jgi:cell division protease FtsH
MNIEEKQEKLNLLRIELKKDFIGIDSVIDQLVDGIRFWYLFPEAQIHPTIICLWGMTGTGKTDLIRRAVSFLKIEDKFLQINGSDALQDGYSCPLERIITDADLNCDDNFILFFDEFQKFRTISNRGEEVIPNKYSDFWDFLSDGKFQYDLESLRRLLDYFLCYDSFEDLKKETENYSRISFDKKYKKILKNKLNIQDALQNIYNYSFKDFKNICEEAVKDLSKTDPKPYSRALIILAGNIDEAYSVASDVAEIDINADWFHEYCKKINFITIKNSLKKRFHPEQIARLGNNHIIYPAFSSIDFKKIIKLKCDKLCESIYTKSNVKINIDDTVYTMIYDNGVFPTQGVRPIISTINSLFSSISKFICESLIKGFKELSISFKNNKLYAIYPDNSESISEISIPVEDIRNKVDSDCKNIVATHELGHALVYSILFGAAPAQICVNSVSSYSNGFILRHSMTENRNNIINALNVLMAGRSAEEIIFGEDSASTGAAGDISQATRKALEYINAYAFDGFSGAVTSEGTNNTGKIFDREKTGEVANNMLKEAKEKSKDILHKNISLYKNLLAFLMKNGKITSNDFIEIFKKNGISLKEIKTGETISLKYEDSVNKFLNS